jgi:tRNA (mo5U34)-methyltransferase
VRSACSARLATVGQRSSGHRAVYLRRVEEQTSGDEALRDQIEAVDWYHALELAPGLSTPGRFDLARVVTRLPWPSLRGKRCLDVGTSQGFWAFEMERRGAAEVIATDVFDPTGWDWPVGTDPALVAFISQRNKRGAAFDIARRALGSSVVRADVSVYDLSPEALGKFDFVFCGALLVHLRDPLLAVQRIRAVSTCFLLSMEPIALGLSLRHPGRPLTQLAGHSKAWWLPNVAAHRRIVEVAGFEVVRTTHPFAVPLQASRNRSEGLGSGVGAPWRRGVRGRVREIAARAVTGGNGVPHAALLARPDPRVPTPKA